MRQHRSLRRSRPALALAAALAFGAFGCGQPDPPDRILLVTIDTLRADHLGLYGYPRGTSPFLDELGLRSLVFETAYASCSHTAPSHASLFTGLQPAQHRLLRNGEALAPSVLTLASLLREKGYRTAGFSTVNFLAGLTPGFEHMSRKDTFHPAKVLVAEARDWIREHEDERFFVWIHLYDVHQWTREDQIDQDALRVIRTTAKPFGRDLLELLEREHGTLFEGRNPRARILRAVDRYDGQILSVDRKLDELYSVLESEGLSQGALWVVTSDHGEGLGNHDHMGHGKTIYNEQTRVPLVVHFTDQRYPPRRIEGLFRLVDVAPAIAEIAGASFEEQVLPLAGRSFLPVLREPGGTWEVDGVFTQRRPADELRLRSGWEPGDVFAYQTEGMKVIAKSEGEPEVYDLLSDPFELKNLIGDPPPEKDRMLRELVRRYREMVRQGEARLGSTEINPEFVEELKALGYL